MQVHVHHKIIIRNGETMHDPVGNRLLGDIRNRKDSGNISRIRSFQQVHLKLDIAPLLLFGQLDKALQNLLRILSLKCGQAWLIQIRFQELPAVFLFYNQAAKSCKELLPLLAKHLQKAGVRIVNDLQYPVPCYIAVPQHKRVRTWSAVMPDNQVFILAAHPLLCLYLLCHIVIDGIDPMVATLVLDKGKCIFYPQISILAFFNTVHDLIAAITASDVLFHCLAHSFPVFRVNSRHSIAAV